MSNTPSNAEAWDLWLESITGGHHPASLAKFARAVLEKWGTPQPGVREPVAYVHVPHFTVEGKVRPVVSFEKYQQDYADGIYSTRIPLYTSPQPAPAPLSEMPYEKRKAIQDGAQISAAT